MAPGRPEPRPATVQLGQAILRALRRNETALGNGPLVLAVSGGADSLAMLLAASIVRESLARDIVIAHLSHGIRKSAERREAAMVRRVARDLHVPLEHEQAAAESSEASARATRYAFFERVAHAHSAAAVAINARHRAAWRWCDPRVVPTWPWRRSSDHAAPDSRGNAGRYHRRVR